MNEKSNHDKYVEEVWHSILTTGFSTNENRYRQLFGRLPSNPRCRICNAPFKGIGGSVVRILLDKRQSNLNPNLCNACEKFAIENQGGAEIELSLLFADVRGSTTLAEKMSALQFSQLINRFYNSVTDVLIRSDALIDRLVGDQVIGLFVPGFAGSEHAQHAIKAAQDIMVATGHGMPDRARIPLGIGVHTGTAFVGAVGSKDGTMDITVLGDAANTAARLSSSAADGEILVSETAWETAALKMLPPEKRTLDLKGKTEPVAVYALMDYVHFTHQNT